MDLQLLQALQHDIDREERLGHEAYAQVLAALQRELVEQWAERAWSPIENIHRRKSALSKQPRPRELVAGQSGWRPTRTEKQPLGRRSSARLDDQRQQLVKTISRSERQSSQPTSGYDRVLAKYAQPRHATSLNTELTPKRKIALAKAKQESATPRSKQPHYSTHVDPMEYYALVSAKDGRVYFDEQHPDIQARALGQYAKHFSPQDLRPVVIEPESERSMKLAYVTGGLTAILGFGGVLLLPSLLFPITLLIMIASAGICAVAVTNQFNKSKPPAITTSKHIHELESSFAKQEPLEVVRRKAAHALSRPHQERVDYTQYAVLVDNPGKMTRVSLMSYRPSTSGYTTRLVQQRRFSGDNLILAAECNGFLENRAAKYEEDARERYEKTVEVVQTGLGKKQRALEEARERKETAKQLTAALDGYDRKVV